MISVKENSSFGQHPLVYRFIKGIFESRPSLPRYQETWDVIVVLELTKLGPPGQRRQTLHMLCVDSMQMSSTKCVFVINSLLKTSRPGKHLGFIEF